MYVLHRRHNGRIDRALRTLQVRREFWEWEGWGYVLVLQEPHRVVVPGDLCILFVSKNGYQKVAVFSKVPRNCDEEHHDEKYRE